MFVSKKTAEMVVVVVVEIVSVHARTLPLVKRVDHGVLRVIRRCVAVPAAAARTRVLVHALPVPDPVRKQVFRRLKKETN